MFSLFIFIFAILGLFVGSFLNVCIDRLPRGQSIINPPSHCSACNRKLSILDLVPLFSYMWLRGRCRYCRASIPLKLPIVEGMTGLLFALLYWKFGLGLELGIALVYISLLIIIFVVDLEHRLILDKVTYPAMALAFAFSFFWPGLEGISWLPIEPLGRVVSAMLGGVIGALPFALIFGIYYWIMHYEGMGLGDVKLAVLVGLMTGFPLVLVALFLSVIAGGLVSAILLAFKVKKRKDPIPFAPFLATSAMVTLLWGQAIYQWYI